MYICVLTAFRPSFPHLETLKKYWKTQLSHSTWKKIKNWPTDPIFRFWSGEGNIKKKYFGLIINEYISSSPGLLYAGRSMSTCRAVKLSLYTATTTASTSASSGQPGYKQPGTKICLPEIVICNHWITWEIFIKYTHSLSNSNIRNVVPGGQTYVNNNNGFQIIFFFLSWEIK